MDKEILGRKLNYIDIAIKKYQWKLIYYAALTNNCEKAIELREKLNAAHDFFTSKRKEIKTDEFYIYSAECMIKHISKEFERIGISWDWKSQRPEAIYGRKGCKGPIWDEDGVLIFDYKNAFIINMN